MANESNLKPFVKGDMRINRKGRPKDFAKLRALAVEMASEQAVDKNGEPILLHGRPVTNAQLVLYQWLTDKKHQKDFIEIAFGKVPQAMDITTKGESIIPDDRFDKAISTLADAVREIIPDQGTK